MPKKLKKDPSSWLQTNALRVTRVHFAYVAAYMISIIVFDSWNLYSHDAVMDRWTFAAILLALNAVFWYVSRMKFNTQNVYINLVLGLVAADVLFAGLNVFWERGIASKSVILFVVPILIAATLRSRSTLLATAALSTAVYSTAAVRYFYQHYGESYRVELYGYLAFYCALFFIFSWFLWLIIEPTREDI